ncbi:protein of unknown function [Candidatus Filomicrobium marinum]|uniref:Uncharacterized protein n=1 Tax=Candidatus Filomicrobium marinum TaxID=1608628 RepID=A0A0D6JG92_9HYPH|nr:protein of unknown function [Candidatus Filomicrobium marinum]CPR19456.1 protein of unknown function [Candidatus Filomicrobium marinum]
MHANGSVVVGGCGGDNGYVRIAGIDQPQGATGEGLGFQRDDMSSKAPKDACAVPNMRTHIKGQVSFRDERGIELPHRSLALLVPVINTQGSGQAMQSAGNHRRCLPS